MNTDTLMTLNQVAKSMGVSRQAVYVSVHNKRIPAQKLGKQWFVSPEQLEEYKRNKYSRAASRREDGELLYDPKKNTYSIGQVARMFEVSTQRVYYLVRNRRLKYERVKAAYVIEISDLDAVRKIVIGKSA